MKLIKTEEAVGHVLCHDMTQIIPSVTKDARFRKGHIVAEEDIPVLLSMGKENLYVWEKTEGMLHEDEAAERLASLCGVDNMLWTDVKEGKIELKAEIDGLLQVDSEKLIAVNSIDDLMIATRHGNTIVHPGDKLAGTRCIPLVLDEKVMMQAEEAVGEGTILKILPFKLKKAAVITTGSEVYHHRIEDKFTPALVKKLEAVGMEMIRHEYVDDGIDNILAAIEAAKATEAELILCTGGMSVDPDDNTPGAIKQSGARIVTYGAPVLPGAMFLLGYYEDGRPIMGLPGCVMYAKATIFDLALARVVCGVEMTKKDFVMMGEGGLCLGCSECRYPICPFGK